MLLHIVKIQLVCYSDSSNEANAHKTSCVCIITCFRLAFGLLHLQTQEGLLMTRKGKILSLITISFVSQLCCYGCSPASKPETPTDAETQVTVNVELNTLIADESGCIFASDENDFSPDLSTIELDITNNLQDEIITGESYHVQVLKDGAWVDISLALFFNQLGLKIAPGSTRVFQCDLHPEKYDYASGEYRLLKEVSVDRRQYTISIKFELCE